MTILQALNTYYERMAARGEAEAAGYSREKISFAIVLSAGGRPIDKIDLREMKGKRVHPRLMDVPAAVERAAGILPNIFWDKTSYALGRTNGKGNRTSDEHAAFKMANLARLNGAKDAGLVALRCFLEQWAPGRFDQSPFIAEMLDTNVVFKLDGDGRLIHEREAAKRLLEAGDAAEGPRAMCLITGTEAQVRRLHPAIKGVEGSQSSGAKLVSFNLDAFTSYGKQQGANAPTSETAAFRYGAALNRMLDRGSRNRIARPIGDASVVFWADTSDTVDEAEAKAAENFFAAAFEPSTADQADDDDTSAAKLRDALDKLAEGRPVRDLDMGLAPGTAFHILGLAPNSARLSVRFWLEGDFAVFGRRLAEHYRDLSIEPAPWRTTLPSAQRLLIKTTALQEKFDNIPPLLAGELMRAVLSGGRYPRTLLSAAIIRLRAGDDPATGWHAAAIRAVLARDYRLKFSKEEIPVSLERNDPNPAYQLGRLFAAMETAQRLALGKINATIRDRYFGAASATPAAVFPILLRGVQNHLGKLRKGGKGGWIEREIEEITGHLPSSLPRSLLLEGQGRFAIGYYHQRKAQFAGRTEEIESEGEGNDND